MEFFIKLLEGYLLLIGITSLLTSINLLFYFFTTKCSILDKFLIQKNKNNKHLNKNWEIILRNLLIMLGTFMVTFIILIYMEPDEFLDNNWDLFTVIWQNIVILLIDDFYYYWYHRALHTKYLFRNCHYIHHRAHNPNILDFIYSHPLEPLIGSFAIILCYMVFLPHMYTICISIFIRHLHESEIHSGYDLPFSISKLIPYLVLSPDHDLHHSKGKGNYGNMFTIWDRIFGTYVL